MNVPRKIAGLAAIILALGGLATAVDEQVLGKKILVKDRTGLEDNRVVIGLGKETSTDVGTPTDPQSAGATLQIITNGTAPSNQTFTLGASGWSATSTGYKYSGPTAGEPVKRVILKRTPGGIALLKVIVKGNVGADPLGVTPPNTASDGGMILEITGGSRYCVSFGGVAGGTTVKDTAQQWKVINATGQPGCPVGAPTTTTSTSSTTSTTAPCDCCGSLPSLLKLSATGGGSSVGAVTPGGPLLQPNLVYVGGGTYTPSAINIVDSRAVPTSTTAYLKIASCSGGNPVLSAATAADVAAAVSFCTAPGGTPTGAERSCSDTGCYAGPPVQLTLSATPPLGPCAGYTEMCGINTFTSPSSGTLACGTGDMETSLTFSKHLICGACPICSGGTVGMCGTGSCSGGSRNGLACTPETVNGTSHDCPPDGPDGGIFGPFTGGGTTGTDSAASFATTGNTNIFCGYCYDGGTYGAACTTDASCAPFACTAHSNGAFRNPSATLISMTGSAAGTCVATGAHPTTIVDVGCVSSVGNTLNDIGGGTPGPTASSVRGTIEIIP